MSRVAPIMDNSSVSNGTKMDEIEGDVAEIQGVLLTHDMPQHPPNMIECYDRDYVKVGPPKRKLAPFMAHAFRAGMDKVNGGTICRRRSR
jgi:hypothetical protein